MALMSFGQWLSQELEKAESRKEEASEAQGKWNEYVESIIKINTLKEVRDELHRYMTNEDSDNPVT